MVHRSSIAKKVMESISVQAVSLLVSFILGFIVPKFIDEYQYAYWQTYVLYVGYVGVLHFGLLDGIVLRYAQYDYDQLDYARLRSQFQILLVWTTCIASAVTAMALWTLDGTACTTACLVAVGIVTRNVVCYNSYLLQITNRINHYARLILCQRLGYGAIVVILLLLHVNRFEWFCLADLAGDVIGTAATCRANRGLFFGHSLPFAQAMRECWMNVSSGVILMLANWSGMLLMSGAKMIVQWHWDELSFGKVSFAFSLSNLFLTFVSAISVVLFPHLKRMDRARLPEVYGNIRSAISILLFIALLFYYPGCWILECYLPNYGVSLKYLGILMPSIIYTSKVSLLTNNYLKAYRMEREMLWINLFSLGVSMVLFVLSAYVFNSIALVLFCVVFSNIVKSVLSEISVTHIIGIRLNREFVIEALMSLAFILFTNCLNRWPACASYAVTLVIYLVLHRQNLANFARQLSAKTM